MISSDPRSNKYRSKLNNTITRLAFKRQPNNNPETDPFADRNDSREMHRQQGYSRHMANGIPIEIQYPWNDAKVEQDYNTVHDLGKYFGYTTKEKLANYKYYNNALKINEEDVNNSINDSDKDIRYYTRLNPFWNATDRANKLKERIVTRIANKVFDEPFRFVHKHPNKILEENNPLWDLFQETTGAHASKIPAYNGYIQNYINLGKKNFNHLKMIDMLRGIQNFSAETIRDAWKQFVAAGEKGHFGDFFKNKYGFKEGIDRNLITLIHNRIWPEE